MEDISLPQPFPRAMSDLGHAGLESRHQVDLDKLIDEFSEIEKKVLEVSGKNNILNIQLDKSNSLLKVTQTREDYLKEECASFQKVIKGLQQTVEYQCNLKDENERLKKGADVLKDKLRVQEQDYKKQLDQFVVEMQSKEEAHRMELTKIQSDLQKKAELKEEEHRELMEKKDMEVLELTKQLKSLEEEKQNEITKLQLEFSARLARAQNKTTKLFPDFSVFPQNIYRRKLQHLQEEKNKEIEILNNTVRELEQRLKVYQEPRHKFRRL
ncbi:coiled-coil domain-containing protein 152 isoform X2 [Tachyglossus aculeatus]|uniref:coiled-coil domain-containing protein 152 isoform X2 n=1 Tax=Tachyglossus aculeatus TaxID=9261 RepID=UPI0018F4FEAD|nr:coiled-coil domain-containing protein 152 isoform X2 [Tachyglossus aculeatus]